MTAPELTRQGDDLLLSWADTGIEIGFSKFSEDRSSGVHCELTIHKRSEPGAGLVHWGRLNLLAPTTRKSLVGTLEKRLPDILWDQMLEDACFLVVHAYREGDPTVDLRQVEAYGRPLWLLEPYIERSGPTVLAAEGGAAKSTLALAMAYGIASGQPVIGKLHTAPMPVLYLDWETDSYTHAQRLSAISAAAHATVLPPVFYRRMTASLSESAEKVRSEIDSTKAGVCIVDSLGFAGNGAPDDSATAIPIFQALRTFGIPALCIHHRTKGGGPVSRSERDSVFGSVYYVNMARRVWTACATEREAVSDPLYVRLKNVKANNGRLEKAHALSLIFENSEEGEIMALAIKRTALEDVPEFAEKMPLRERIISQLKRGAKAMEDIASDLDADEGQVRARLNEMRRKGLVIQLPQKQWGLAEVEQREAHWNR